MSAEGQLKIKAKMDGIGAALNGEGLDANAYGADSDLHFEWLQGWASARLEMQKRMATKNAKSTKEGGE